MATAFTHAFTASLLAPLAPASVPRPALIFALSVVAVFPDIDVLAFGLGIAYSDPFGHRGFTHSIAFAAAMGPLCACLFLRYVKPSRRDWFVLAALFFLASLSHGVLDAFTDAGHGIAFFWPLDNTRYFFPSRPLETSPIGITSFFNGNALDMLKNELLWVWLPIGGLFVAIFSATSRLRGG